MKLLKRDSPDFIKIGLLFITISVSACASSSLDQLAGTTALPSAPHNSPDTLPPSMETTASIPSPRSAGQNQQGMSYEAAYSAYNRQAETYWNDIANKRKIRNEKRRRGQTVSLNDYVLTQPPVYTGPPRPADTNSGQPVKHRDPIPRTSDFITASQRVYGYTPERPRSEEEFMRSYAAAAAAAGLTRNQLVSLYAFETGGNGTHDLQAGMLQEKSGAKPISTAVGYNQLVATASVSVMSEFGPTIAEELRQQARRANGNDRTRLLKKANVVDDMTTRARSVPHRWSAQIKLSKTPVGLGIHAMTLDKDIGPLLQIHKLRTSMHYLRSKGVNRPLTGAELEMLNLTGDGNGFDMITMPVEFRSKVPTSNFFIRNGYERNPVAKRNNTVAQLLQATTEKMQANMQKDGAQALHQAFRTTELAHN